MSNGSRSPLWPYVLAAFVLVAIYLYFTVEIRPDPGATRPTGDVEDIARLGERDDTNVLFILVDTLRAERMSAHGYERETTPFLSRLASTGIRFDRHIAQSSWTKSSMASLWTSLSPVHSGVTKFNHAVSEEAVMPAEILQDAGFRTVGLYRNGWVHGYFGFDQGFDKYYRPMGFSMRPQLQRLRPNTQAKGDDENVVEDAIEFLRIHGKTSRWLLYLHLMDLHEYTYDEESALFGNEISDLYDNSVLRTDWVISTLYDYLASEDLLEKTIVVILSDHGEAFGERGFEGHARAVFPETTETPLILSLPFALREGIVVEEVTTNNDVWPTLLELLGFEDGRRKDGQSRVEAILAAGRGEPPAETPAEFSIAFIDENWGRPGSGLLPSVSVLEGDFRYVMGSDVAGRRFEVLLSTEDGQVADRIADHPEIADRLREVAKREIESEAVFAPKIYELDQMQLDQLRALGYELP